VCIYLALKVTVEEARNGPLLIVDDDKAIRNLLARVAQRAGFVVETAKDGQEALEMIQQNSYSIAIIDLMMPRMSGYELLERISAMNPRPTVIVATANADVAKLDDSLVRRVLRKPFDINAVAAALVETAKQVADQRALLEEPIMVPTSTDVQIEIIPGADNQEEMAASGTPDQQDEPAVEAPPAEDKPKVEEPPPS